VYPLLFNRDHCRAKMLRWAKLSAEAAFGGVQY